MYMTVSSNLCSICIHSMTKFKLIYLSYMFSAPPMEIDG